MAEYNLLLRNVFKDSLLVYILLKTKTVLRLIVVNFCWSTVPTAGRFLLAQKVTQKRRLGSALSIRGASPCGHPVP